MLTRLLTWVAFCAATAWSPLVTRADAPAPVNGITPLEWHDISIVAAYLAELDREYQLATRGMGCRSGTELAPARKAAARFIGSREQRAWLHLALPTDDFIAADDRLRRARYWSDLAFVVSSAGHSPLDAPHASFVVGSYERTYLLDHVRYRFDRDRSLNPSVMETLARVRCPEMVPLLIKWSPGSTGAYAPRSYLSKFALRVPKSFRDGVDYERDEHRLAKWDADWKAWWDANQSKTQAHTVVAAALAGELPLFEGSAELLVDAVLRGGNHRVPAAELSALVEAAWPAQSNLPAYAHEVMAEQWHMTRNAAFLIAYHRDPPRALAWLSAGLEESDRVGCHRPSARTDRTSEGISMNRWLPPQLRTALEQRVRDVRTAPLLRMKWLVLHDQMFPPGYRAFRYLYVGKTAPWTDQMPADEWAVVRLGPESHSSEFATDAKLLEHLAARGYSGR
jgi:hypothetical protein